MVESTFRPEVLTKIGGFAGCVSLNLERYKKPILVSSTDGVGTKLKIDGRDLRQTSVSGGEGFLIGEIEKAEREQGAIELI